MTRRIAPSDRHVTGGRRRHAAWKRSVKAVAVFALIMSTACAEVGSGPDVPAAIELTTLPSPSVVIGDTLRNVDGVVTPIQAIVRNVKGEIIPDAAVRYLYADYERDSALAVDSVSGLVFASRAATGDARLTARVGSTLQILKKLIVTVRPDSMDRKDLGELAVFTTTLPDTGRTGATKNTSSALSVTVRHISEVGVTSAVNGWPVRFELIKPANATNDTTKAVYLVDDVGRASVLDTTDASGKAGRQVRVRAAQYLSAGETDTVEVRVTASYKSTPLLGAPVIIKLPVKHPN